MIDQPTAEEPLKKLEPLLGEWALEAGSPDGEPWPGQLQMARIGGAPGRAHDGRYA